MYEEDEVEIPIYLITGFLESGKTSFINFTVAQDYFQIDGPTLLITTEEGEVEYDEKELLKHNTVLEIVEGPEQFTLDYLKKLNRKYRPERIILEYNPLWSVKKLEEMELPRGWGIVQEIVTVDASCFQIYMQNMKSVFMEMAKNADMVMFNRCRPEDPLPSFRRSIKVVNQACDVLFENEEGEIDNIFEDLLDGELSFKRTAVLLESHGFLTLQGQLHKGEHRGDDRQRAGQLDHGGEIACRLGEGIAGGHHGGGVVHRRTCPDAKGLIRHTQCPAHDGKQHDHRHVK